MSVIRTRDRNLPVDEPLIAAIEERGLAHVLNGAEFRRNQLAGRAQDGVTRAHGPRTSQIDRYVRKPEYAASLRLFNEQWFFDDPGRLPSHRKTLGGLTALVRRWSLGALRILTFPTFERQRTFNSAVTQFLNELNAALIGANGDLEQIFREQALLGRDVDETRELEARLAARLDETEESSRQLVQERIATLSDSLTSLSGKADAATREIGTLRRELNEQRLREDERGVAMVRSAAEASRRLETVEAATEERWQAVEKRWQAVDERWQAVDDRWKTVSDTVQQLTADSVNLYHHLVNLGIVFRSHPPRGEGTISAALQRRFGELRYVRCMLCGADDTDPVGSKEGLRVVRCRPCGLMYVNPRLPVEAVSELYALEYWYARQAEHGYSDVVERFAYDYILALGRLSIIRKHRLSGVLLDVGCSNGAFVRRASEWGFRASGLELDEDVARLAERISGVSVLVGPLETQELPNASLDVITAFDVVEHLYEPFAFLERARRLLTPDGILVFETFRTDVPAFGNDPEKHDDFKPLEHVYMYTEANLDTLVARSGFEVLETIYPMGSSHSRVLKICRSGRAQDDGA